MAAVIVMDPKSGEILAMDTSTRYDLNNPYDLSAYYSQEEIDAMDEKAKSDAWYKLWRNFCVNDTYEPGSPQKAFTVAGAWRRISSTEMRALTAEVFSPSEDTIFTVFPGLDTARRQLCRV